MSFAYHNHMCNSQDRRLVLTTLLLKETDPALVQMEMDIGWGVCQAAADRSPISPKSGPLSLTAYQDLKNIGIPNNHEDDQRHHRQGHHRLEDRAGAAHKTKSSAPSWKSKSLRSSPLEMVQKLRLSPRQGLNPGGVQRVHG